MRVPLAATLESRDGTVDQDAKVLNGIVETRGEASAVRKRPGLSDIGLMRAGVAQALTYWNSRATGILDDYLILADVSSTEYDATWQAVTLPQALLWLDIAYGNGVYAAIASNSTGAAYSSNGTSWTAASLPTSRAWKAVAYGNGVFVAIASSTNYVARSTDYGQTWSESAAMPENTSWIDVCYSPSLGKFLAISQNGYSATSSDGATWAAGGTYAAYSFNTVVWADDLSLFVMVANSGGGYYGTSATGASWTVAAFPSAASPTYLCWNGTLLLASGYGTAYYWTSTNGTSWTRRDNPATMGTTWYATIACGSAFIGVKYAPSDIAIASGDGITWEASTISSSGYFQAIGTNGVDAVVVANQNPPSGSTAGSLASVYLSPASLSSTSLSPTTADLQFSMQDNGANSPGGSLLMFKNSGQAWYVNTSGTVTQITDTDYPGTYAVSVEKLTRSSTTATAVTRTPTNFQVGSSVTIAGVNEAGWNGSYTITGVTAESEAEGEAIKGTITRAGTTATFNSTEKPHGFANGASIVISGADQTEYNGTKTITWTSSTTFTFTVTVSGQEAVSPGTGTYYWASNQLTGNVSVTSGTARVELYDIPKWANGITAYVAFSYNPFGQGWQIQAGEVALTATSTPNHFTFATGLADTEFNGYVPCTAAISTKTATSVTSDGALATLTAAASHYLQSGAQIVVWGGNQSYYATPASGRQVTVTGAATFTYPITLESGVTPIYPATGTITAKGGSTPVGASFTFTVDGTETTPATGTITATSGRTTVPGIAFIDGYFCVMDIYGVIYTSEPNDPASWEALHFITAQSDTGAGKYLGKTQSYVVAMKAFSTEFFYNAGNPTGSPLSPVANAFTQVGCAHGDSVAKVDGNIAWLSQTRESGRAVHIINGMQQQKISTPDVDRILNADDLATVRGMGLKVDGHHLYVLTLVTSDITLVYDLTSQAWTQWSTLTIGSQVSVSSITRSGTTATVNTGSAHGFSDGAPVKISGATQSDYNGIFQIAYISTTSFSIEVANSPATPATGTILAYPYTETYFKFGHATSGDGVEYIAHESDGHIYEVDSTLYQDNAVPINLFVRTPRLDGAETRLKKMPRITLIGDKQSDTAMIRWSDDDSATFSAYRRVDLSDAEPMLRRCGSFRRRSLEVRHTGNTAQRFGSLELEVSQ